MGVAVQRGIQPMQSILLDYYFTFFEILVILFLIGGAGIAVYWVMRRHWQNRLKTLEQKHADDLAKHDSEHFQAFHDHLHSAVAHEFVKGLDYILEWSAKTLERLGDEQLALRQKQKRIIAKAYELDQHAENILDLFASQGETREKEFLNLRGLVERALIVKGGLLDYAESKGVTLVENLDDVEPTALNKNLTLLALKNVIHNAIKYSFPGGVVEIVLSLERGEEDGAGKMIYVEVKDRGQGIPEEDQDTIFDLEVRGGGLIEPGSGLGLYLARKAARRQGGDVVLVTSTLNQGSVFKITLPYIDFEE
jgi:signal transduction histidine kinase